MTSKELKNFIKNYSLEDANVSFESDRFIAVLDLDTTERQLEYSIDINENSGEKKLTIRYWDPNIEIDEYGECLFVEVSKEEADNIRNIMLRA